MFNCSSTICWQGNPSSTEMLLYFCGKVAEDFPGGTGDRNLPASAGDMGSSPGPGRFHMPWSNWAHEPQLLSLCSRALELQLLRPSAATTETCEPRVYALQQEKPPQLEKACTQQRRSRVAKNKEENTGWGTEKNPNQNRINKKKKWSEPICMGTFLGSLFCLLIYISILSLTIPHCLD